LLTERVTVQKNGTLYVLETMDFTITQKKRSRDHAGWAYMFRDIRDQRNDADTIAVIRVRPEDKEVDDVRNGLALLGDEANIVDWLETKEREAFIKNRKTVAISS